MLFKQENYKNMSWSKKKKCDILSKENTMDRKEVDYGKQKMVL